MSSKYKRKRDEKPKEERKRNLSKVEVEDNPMEVDHEANNIPTNLETSCTKVEGGEASPVKVDHVNPIKVEANPIVNPRDVEVKAINNSESVENMEAEGKQASLVVLSSYRDQCDLINYIPLADNMFDLAIHPLVNAPNGDI